VVPGVVQHVGIDFHSILVTIPVVLYTVFDGRTPRISDQTLRVSPVRVSALGNYQDFQHTDTVRGVSCIDTTYWH
jgi:hypothetical protein